MVTIKFKKQFKGKEYYVYVERPKNLTITIYMSDYIFLSSMLDDKYLKQFKIIHGRPTNYELGKIKNVKVLKIEEINDNKNIFKL